MHTKPSIADNCRIALHGEGWPFAWVLIISGFANALGGVLNPLALRWIVDRGIRSHNLHVFIGCSIVSFLCFSGWRGLILYHRNLLLRIKQRLLVYHARELWQRYFASDYGVARKLSASYHLSFVYDEVLASVLPFIERLITFCSSLIGAATCLVFMLILAPGPAAFVALAIPPLNLLSAYFTRRIRATSTEEQTSQADARDEMGTAISSLATARLFGMRDPVTARLSRRLASIADALYRRDSAITMFQAFSGFSSSAAEIAIIVVSGYEVLQGHFTFGTFFAFMNVFWMALGSSRAAMESLPELLRLNSNLQILAGKYPAHAYAPLNTGRCLTLDHVDFAMESNAILTGVSLSVTPGTKAVIRGANGSGKSTLALLMGGLLEPCRGRVVLPRDGSIAVITDPMNFPPGALADILPKGRPAGATDYFAARLGLQSLLHKRPDEMSAGQRKKAQILFGLSMPASIYLFDEPLAHLDPMTKATVMELILDAVKESTLIVILHGDDEFNGYFDAHYTLERGRLTLAAQPLAAKEAV